MEWIWLLFIIFSVVFGLIDKLSKTVATSDRKDQSPERRPFPFFEPEEEYSPEVITQFEDDTEVKAGVEQYEKAKETPGEPFNRPSYAGVEGIPSELMESPFYSSHEGMAHNKVNEAALPEMQEEKKLREAVKADDDLETMELEEAENAETAEGFQEPEKFITTFKLAQVLKRPDFKTIPWQRRL